MWEIWTQLFEIGERVRSFGTLALHLILCASWANKGNQVAFHVSLQWVDRMAHCHSAHFGYLRPFPCRGPFALLESLARIELALQPQLLGGTNGSTAVNCQRLRLASWHLCFSSFHFDEANSSFFFHVLQVFFFLRWLCMLSQHFAGNQHTDRDRDRDTGAAAWLSRWDGRKAAIINASCLERTSSIAAAAMLS